MTYTAGINPTIESVAEAMMKNVMALHESIARTRSDLDSALQDVIERERKQERKRRTKLGLNIWRRPQVGSILLP